MRKTVVIGLVLLAAGCGADPAPPAAAPPASSATAQSPAPVKPSATAPASAKPTAPARANCDDTYKSQIPRSKLVGTDNTWLCFHPTGDMSRHDRNMLPKLCGKLEMPSDDQLLDRAGVHEIFNLGGGPTSLSHTVTHYSTGGSIRYMADLRDALKACGPTTKDGFTYTYSEVEGPALREESLYLKATWHTDQPDDYAPTDGSLLISVVRAGDYISVLHDQGWESHPTPREAFDGYAATAAGLI